METAKTYSIGLLSSDIKLKIVFERTSCVVPNLGDGVSSAKLISLLVKDSFKAGVRGTDELFT